MAVATYGASDQIAWSSFIFWSNQYSSAANVSLDTVMNNLEPADSAPHQASEIRGNSFLYGNVYADGASGTVAVTTGYSQGATTSFALRNVNFNSISSVVITATATYPVYLEGFYTATNGGGTLLQNYDEPTTSGTLTLTSGTHTGVTDIYAYFVDAHA